MKTPAFEIKVNGKAVASIVNERLISLTVTDKEGVGSDSIDVGLNDGNPFAAIPKKGDKIEVSLGYSETGILPFGAFTVDDPEIRCLPYGMNIRGRGANIRDKFKQSRSRHWDEKTVAEILQQIASENGLQPVIDDEVASHKYDWFGQQDESDMHVCERLARIHGALFSVKDGKLIFAKRGSGKSASGKDLTPIVVGPFEIVQGTCRINFAYRKKVKTVRAKVRDRAKAETVEVEEDSDDEGTADFTVKENFSTEAEAKKAAKSKAESLKAETVKTFVTVFGDPTIRAGAPFSYQNVRPEIDGIEFIIETATHRISKSGYMTDIEAKLKPVASKAPKDKKKSTKASTSKTNENSPKTPVVPDPKPQAPATSTTGGSPMGMGIGRA